MEIAELDELVKWMRFNGVRRVNLAGIEVEFGPNQLPPAEQRPPAQLTEEERARLAFQKRKERYERELGRKLSDEEVKALP